jgi:hypothetical protein
VTTTDPATIVDQVQTAWKQWLLRGQKTASSHPTVWASSYRACERRMVFDLVSPDQQPAPDVTLLAKFRRGDDRERDLLADLGRIGRDAEPSFALVGQQERFELRGRTGEIVISGKVDARLRVGDDRRASGAPLEVKAWAPTLVDKIETFDDLFENQYTRAGGYQLLSYLYGANEPYGFLLLDRSGLPLLLPVELTSANLERMEEFLSRAESVVAHRHAGTLPDYIDDPTECKRCGYYGVVCQPPLLMEGATVIDDPELEAHLARWWELRPAGKEYQALDIDLKKRLRGVLHALVGPFALTGKWGKSSRLEVPAHLKKQFTVSDPQGRFTLEIDRL